MINRILWPAGSHIALRIAAILVIAWMASNCKVLAFEEGLSDQGRLINTTEVAYFFVEKGAPAAPGTLALRNRAAPKEAYLILQNDRVRKLATAAKAPNPLLTQRFLKSFMHRTEMIHPNLVASLQTSMARQGCTQAVSDRNPQLFKTLADALIMDPEEWRDLDPPLALIWGGKDTVTPLNQGQELAALLPNLQLTVSKDVGHIPHLEAPSEFAHALMIAFEQIPSNKDRNAL